MISVLLEDVAPTNLPIGMFSVQAVSLTDWSGETSDERFLDLRGWLEHKLTPVRVQRALEQRDMTLRNESRKAGSSGDSSPVTSRESCHRNRAQPAA